MITIVARATGVPSESKSFMARKGYRKKHTLIFIMPKKCINLLYYKVSILKPFKMFYAIHVNPDLVFLEV